MIHKRLNQRGETIVEVMAAFLLLLTFMAVFAASLRFARAMTVKAETLREQAYVRVSQLYPVNNQTVNWTQNSETANLTFTAKATGSGFTVQGVKLQTNKATDGAADFDFHRYTK